MKIKIIKLVLIFILIMSLFKTGAISKFLNNINLYLFGITFFWIIIIIIIFIGLTFLNKKKQKYYRKYLIALALAGASIELILELIRIKITGNLNYEFFVDQTVLTSKNINDGIGFIQTFFEVSLSTLFGSFGIYLISFLLFGIAVLLILDVDSLVKKIMNLSNKKKSKPEKKSKSKSKKNSSNIDESEKTVDLKKYKKDTTVLDGQIKVGKKKEKEYFFEPQAPIGNKNITTTYESSKEKKMGKKVVKDPTDVKAQKVVNKVTTVATVDVASKANNPEGSVVGLKNNKIYKVPSVELLNDVQSNKEKYKQIQRDANKKSKELLNTLESFKVKAELSNVIVGNSITKYELKPEKGQKVNKFLTLNNDLAMALAARSIRIEAPIPGKSLVGIEIPNEERLTVGLKELINPNIYDKKSKLKVALGTNIEGETEYLDIEKAPHLLVAGATGSGKSVCINGIITNLLLNSTPEEVKFLLVDPKKVELTPYNGIPHLLSPVITDPEKAAVALNRLVHEMEERYELFATTRTRNIESYNKIEKDNPLPYIVTIIDELADLMMVSGTEVEIAISRIAQKARAAGIHLILATQRPSTDVITGLIKSNIPTRISFMVSSSIDSRTILDTSGAEKLLGNGDMLLSSNGSPNLQRIQGAYLSDEEIMRVVNFINNQFSSEDINDYYKEDFVKLEVIKKENSNSEDSLLTAAIEIGIEEGKLSTSMLQRKLKIGFNRATTIMEQLEDKQWISKSPRNNKGREILVNREDIYGDMS